MGWRRGGERFIGNGTGAFERQQVIRRRGCIVGRPENLDFVVLKGFDPRADVRRVLFRIVRNASLGCEEDARKFRAELLLGVVGIAKFVRRIERWAVQPGWVAGPVRKLVKGGPIVSGGILECLFGREMDAVGGQIVAGPVRLIVIDRRSGIIQNPLGRIHDFKGSWSLWLIFRDTVDLFGIEYGVHSVDKSCVTPALFLTVLAASDVVAG